MIKSVLISINQIKIKIILSNFYLFKKKTSVANCIYLIADNSMTVKFIECTGSFCSSKMIDINDEKFQISDNFCYL